MGLPPGPPPFPSKRTPFGRWVEARGPDQTPPAPSGPGYPPSHRAPFGRWVEARGPDQTPPPPRGGPGPCFAVSGAWSAPEHSGPPALGKGARLAGRLGYLGLPCGRRLRALAAIRE